MVCLSQSLNGQLFTIKIIYLKIMPEGEPKLNQENSGVEQPKTYKPVEGPQFQAPDTNAEELVDKMFDFDPLRSLTDEEMTLVRQYSLEQATEYLENLKHVKPDTGGGVGGGSRGLSGYGNMEEIVKETFNKNGAKVKILDVGCGQGHMLHELKEKLGDRVETHGLAPADDNLLPVDQFHLLHAEYLPKEFNRKFDVIVSQVALDYSLLPHSALKNISDSLAEGGVARISYDYGREHRQWERTTLAENLKNYLVGNNLDKLTSGGRKLIEEGFIREECKKIFMAQASGGQIENVTQEQWQQKLETSTTDYVIREEARRRIGQLSEAAIEDFAKGALPINEKLVKAWTNAVAELIENPELEVKLFYGYRHPARVEFTRKSR